MGSPTGSRRRLLCRIATVANAKILACQYRLSPEFRYPHALCDAVHAYTFLLREWPASCVVVMGDSAGGNLALVLVSLLRSLGLPSPAACALLSPWLDLTHSFDSYKRNSPSDFLPPYHGDYTLGRMQHYCLDSQLVLPHVSPVFALSPSCPVLVQVGDAERLYDENLYYALSHSGVTLEVYQDMPHVFQLFPFRKCAAGPSSSSATLSTTQSARPSPESRWFRARLPPRLRTCAS